MTTAIATSTSQPITFVPDAPIETAQGLKRLLEASKPSIAQALPRHVTPERLIKTLLVAANRTPDLLRCTQASILETINRAAELGLDLSGTLGEAYPVPYSSGGRKVCQLIIGYRGLAKLAWQSGEVKRIEAEVVYSGDSFIFRKGINGTLEFTPNFSGDRGTPIGAYALVEMKSGGVQYDFLSTAQIESVRAKSQSKNSPAWRDHWDEMAKKTAFRRVAKWLPLSTEKFVSALEHEGDSGPSDIIEVSTIGTESRTNRLLQDLTGEAEQDSASADAGGEVTITIDPQERIYDFVRGWCDANGTPIPSPEAIATAVDAWAKTTPYKPFAKAIHQPGMADRIIELAQSVSWGKYI